MSVYRAPVVPLCKQSLTLQQSAQATHTHSGAGVAARHPGCVLGLKKSRIVDELGDKERGEKKPSKLLGSLRTGQAAIPEVNRMRRPNNPVKASCTSPPSPEH